MSIDPKILKRMQGDDSFLESQRSGSRRVKLNRGQNWIVRFLPARLGPDGLWYARIARHWLNRLPVVCPRNTAEDFGGDPECECPVCVLAEELNESADEVISKFGYKSKANAQFLTYCIVWEKDGVQQPMSEILNPYEFWHYRSTWEELKGFYLAGGRKCPDSVFDYERGNDFSVNKTAKGLRLDKQDSSPIFDPREARYAEWIKKLESAMKTPRVVIPTHEQLQVFAAKLQEAANRGGTDDDDRGRRGGGGGGRYDDDDDDLPRRGGGGASRRPPAEEEDDLPYDDAPPARSAARAAAPARRTAPEPEDAGEPAEEPSPRRRTAPVDDTPPRRGSAPTDEDAPPPRRGAPTEDAGDEPPPPRRAAPTARRTPPPEPEDNPNHDPDPDGSNESPDEVTPPARGAAPARRTLEPTARRAAGRAEPSITPQGDAEEDDPLPEDDTDPAPPAPKGRAEAEGDEAPPPVARRGGQTSSIKDRIAKLPKRA